MKNRFERNPFRESSDGSIHRYYPFHISLEGLETRILCRENEDYDVFVKIIAVCARRKGVYLITYGVVSNHGHCVVLAPGKEAADDCAEEIKRMFSMYCKRLRVDVGAFEKESSGPCCFWQRPLQEFLNRPAPRGRWIKAFKDLLF